MYQLIVYVPKTYVEKVKASVFATGAGRLGDYENCCWQILGKGQFKPLGGSQPFLGEQGKVEVVDEYRVEMVVTAETIDAAVAALKAAHPYETPAYHVIECLDI